MINTTTTTTSTAEIKLDEPKQHEVHLNYQIWEIVLLVYLSLIFLILFTCCVCSTFLKHNYNKFFKKKIDGVAKAIHLDSFSLSLYKEQIQPDVEKLANDYKKNPSNKNQAGVRLKKGLGSVEYSLDYDFNKAELTVIIYQAMALQAKDANGLSDPYIILTMLPDKKKFQTRMLRKTLNPVFNESFTFKNVQYYDIRGKVLLFLIYDYDRFSRHDQIGEIRLPLANIDLGKHSREWMDIQLPTEKDNSELGSICFSLRYAPTAGKITVTVFEAKNLKKMDIGIGRLSDPYVKVSLFKNGKRVEKRKTSIKFFTLNPYYNESVTFDKVYENELKDGIYNIVITVVDYDRIGKSEPIGKVCIGPSAFDLGLRHWNEMLDSPRRPIAYWHQLTDIDEN